MEEKKIATSVDLLINVDKWEHIQITKYAEKKITYESKEEMIKKEDELTDELVGDIIRTMRGLPDKLGKKTNAVLSMEEKIQKKIPGWLENELEPNIANLAKENYEKNIASVNAKSEEIRSKKEEEEKIIADLISTEEKPKEEKPKSNDDFSDDLFDDESLFGEK